MLGLFWWPTLYNDILRYISNCEMCVGIKPQHSNPGKMGIRTFPKSPMELVTIDYLVELPMAERGNQYILSINDHFTKFTQIYAVSDRTAMSAVKCVFDPFFEVWNGPKVIF